MFLVYGDLASTSESFGRLTEEATSGDYAAVFHIGDIAYDLHSDAGQVTTD